MSFLKKLFRPSDDKQPSANKLEDNNPSNIEVAKDPVLFAQWINKYVVMRPIEEDYQYFTPPKKHCEDLKISEDQRRLIANECVLLRALGACLCVRNNLNEDYYLKFKETILPDIAERMDRNAPQNHKDDIYEAINQYINALKSEGHSDFTRTYFDRVLSDISCQEAFQYMYEYPIKVGLNQIMFKSYEATSDGYGMLMTSLPYDAWKKVVDLLKDNSDKKS